jgi:glycosyltransferase involved in cell wall biosynthesis
MWSHVNGYFPPQIFFSELFELPDRFVFSTETSNLVPVVHGLPDKIKTKLRVIRSCSGIPEGAESICPKSGPFHIGYIGTVEPVKMHADFLSMCANASIQSPCIVVGGPAHEELRKRAEAMNLASSFNILGPVDNPKPIFRKLHAFAYPLSPRHYGTGEQVLIEAMAFGAVPVVLANLPEAAIVRHGETGLVAKNATDFSSALRMLMENPAERDRLADGGHRFVMEKCGIEHSTEAFHELFDETLSLPKCARTLNISAIDGVKYGSPVHLFLASLGESEERLVFDKILQNDYPDDLPEDFASKTRGTPFHYLNMLGDDPELEAVCNSMLRRN